MKREELATLIEDCRRLLIAEFGARRVIPFGSAVGDGPWHERSDLDLAVEGLLPERFFKAWGALQRLAPPGLVIDLVALETAPPELRARILRLHGGRGERKETKMAKAKGKPREPRQDLRALQRLVEEELKALERTVEEAAELLKASADPPTRTELRAMAGLVHEFYTGVESIFRHIVVRLGEGLPRGEEWHKELLARVATARKRRRPALIDEPLRALLEEYLDFRHFFRHAYGYTLEWPRLRPLMADLSSTFEELRAELEAFFAGRFAARGVSR